MDLDEENGDLRPRSEADVDMVQPLQLQRHPVSLTAGVYKGQLILDLDAQEDEILGSSATVVVDEKEHVLGALPV